MKLLLDTHILLWSLLEPEKLSKRVASDLEDSDSELWISPITTWEILVLAEKGRIQLNAPDPASWIRSVYSTVPLKEAALNHEVAIVSQSLDLNYRDPADRFIAATAIVYDLTLVTADKRLLASYQIPCLKS